MLASSVATNLTFILPPFCYFSLFFCHVPVLVVAYICGTWCAFLINSSNMILIFNRDWWATFSSPSELRWRVRQALEKFKPPKTKKSESLFGDGSYSKMKNDLTLKPEWKLSQVPNKNKDFLSISKYSYKDNSFQKIHKVGSLLGPIIRSRCSVWHLLSRKALVIH